jgi:hypothetical protein
MTYAHGHKKAPDEGGCFKDYRFNYEAIILARQFGLPTVTP